jgi:hypothetical protein
VAVSLKSVSTFAGTNSNLETMIDWIDLASLRQPSRSLNSDLAVLFSGALYVSGGVYLSTAISNALFSCALLKNTVSSAMPSIKSCFLINERF